MVVVCFCRCHQNRVCIRCMHGAILVTNKQFLLAGQYVCCKALCALLDPLHNAPLPQSPRNLLTAAQLLLRLSISVMVRCSLRALCSIFLKPCGHATSFICHPAAADACIQLGPATSMDEGHDKSRPTRVVGGIGAFHGQRINWRGAAWAVVERLPVSSSTDIHTNHWLGGCADDGLCIQGLLVRIPLKSIRMKAGDVIEFP